MIKMSEEGFKLLSSIADGMVTHVDFMYRTPEGYISIIPELDGMTEDQMVRRITSKTSNTAMVARFMYSLLNHSKPPSGYNEWFTKMASDVEQQEKMVDRLRIFWKELERGFVTQEFREVNEHRLGSGIAINQEDLPAIYKSCVEGDGWMFTYSSDRGSFSKPPGLIGPHNAIGVSGLFEFEIRDEVVIESSMTGVEVLALMKRHIPSIPWRLNRTERVALIEQSLSLRDFHYFTFTNPMMSICSSMDETKHLFVTGRNPVTKVNMEPLIPEFTMTIGGEGIRVSCSDINLAVKAVSSIIFLMKPEEVGRNPAVLYSKLDVLKSLKLVDVQPVLAPRRYSARVQCATQPSVIGDDEIIDWGRFIVETNVDGTILETMNQPGNFLKIEGHINLICTNMIDGISDTRFANFTGGLPQCSAESRTGKINRETSIMLKCATPVIPGRVSEVSVSMKEILQGFSGLRRLGVGTILGCVRESGLEIDVSGLLLRNPSFFSQYFPWATDAEIRRILEKNFDQLAIIPALEEILDITIYVLNLGTAVKSNQVMVNPFPPMFKRAPRGGFLLVALSGQSVDLIRYESSGEDPLGVLEKARIASRPIESQHPSSHHEMDLRPLFKRVVSQEIQCGKAISLRAKGEGGAEADFKIPMTAPYDLPRSVGNLGTSSNLIPSFFTQKVKDVRDEGDITFTVGSVKMSTTKSHGNIDLFNEADMKRSAELAYTLVRWVLGFVRVNESVSSYLDRIVSVIDRDHPISNVPMFLRASSEAEAFSEISKVWPEFVQSRRFMMTQETIDALKKGIQVFPLRKETVRTSSYFDSLRSFDARCEVFYRSRIQDGSRSPDPGEVKVVGEFLVRSVTSPRQGAYVLAVWELARVNTFDEPPGDIELGTPGFIDVSQGFSQGMFVIAGIIYVALKLPNA